MLLNEVVHLLVALVEHFEVADELKKLGSNLLLQLSFDHLKRGIDVLNKFGYQWARKRAEIFFDWFVFELKFKSEIAKCLI